MYTQLYVRLDSQLTCSQTMTRKWTALRFWWSI